MENPASPHPTDRVLSDFSLGKLDDAMAGPVNAHVEVCPDCQRRVAEMTSDSLLGRLRDAQGGPTVGSASPVASPTATLPPELTGHPDYEVVRELGRGGMGVVYLAKNRLMGRDEVLKIVGRHLIERPGVLDRFTREIRSAARLKHANIVHAYSAFRCGEGVVFAMEYVDGLDLAKLVATRGPLSVAHACYFAYQAALGLQHAHEQGMVHRDIKPGNLILAREGTKATVKVLDFGLAKATRENPLDGGLTHEGQMLGTPDYIAPEQIRDAQSAGIGADIYSLGCTLYYLLAGRPPFRGASLYDLLQAHFSMDAHPLNLARPEVPAELAALVGKMMAKEPGRRFKTPGEVAEALKPFFKPGATRTSPELSQVGAPDPGRPTVAAASVVLPASAPPSRPIDAGPKPESPASAMAEGPGRRPPWVSRRVVAAAGGAVGLAILGIAILLVIKNGRVTVKTLDDTSPLVTAGDTPKGGVEVPAPPVAPARPTETPAVAEVKPATVVQDPTPPESQGPPAALRNDAKAGPVVLTNSIGLKLAAIPAGEFLMGSPDSDLYAEDAEKPQHPVKIARPFYLGVHEVTVGQYRAILQESPGEQKEDDLPIVQVSWKDAVEFCNVLSAREGLEPYYRFGTEPGAARSGGEGYRLPTEAEWEYACRAGTTTRFPGGDSIAGADEFSWYSANSGDKLHPVGGKRPNAFGLYDMLGNACEWCGDVFAGDAYAKPPAAGPLDLSLDAQRVIRGGGIKNLPRACRSALRIGYGAGGRAADLGFRIARDAPAAGVAARPIRAIASSPPKPAPAAMTDPAGVMTNSIGLKLAPIPAGEFFMGSPDSDLYAEDDEKPQRKVTIARPFYLGVHEVTVGQYRAIMKENPSDLKDDNLPIMWVSWKDAVEFCNVLSARENLAPYYRFGKDAGSGGEGYRLPTEAEWEYACRAGTTTRFLGGDSIAGADEFSWYAANSDGKLHPVGGKRPNAFGLHDMLGNAWEWCSDVYTTDAYAKQASGPLDLALTVKRAARGGCLKDLPRACRSANREWWNTGSRANELGFRVARDAPAAGIPAPRAGVEKGPGPAVAAPAGPGLEPDPKAAPEEWLKWRGLTRSGSYYVVATEAEVLGKFREVRPLTVALAKAFDTYAAALRCDMLLAEAEAYRTAVDAEIAAANAAMPKAPAARTTNSLEVQAYQAAKAYRDGLSAERDGSAKASEALRQQRGQAGPTEELAKDFLAKRSAFLKAAGALRPSIERAAGEYRGLKAEPTIKAALAAIQKAKKAPALLGPSKDYQKAIDDVRDAERAYSTESAAPKKSPKPRPRKPGPGRT